MYFSRNHSTKMVVFSTRFSEWCSEDRVGDGVLTNGTHPHPSSQYPNTQNCLSLLQAIKEPGVALGLVDESQNIVPQRSYESFWVYKLLCKRIFLRNHYCGG